MEQMKHRHVGKLTDACQGCYDEIQAELRSRRFWGWAIVGFALAFSGVMAFVLYKVGPMGR